ncbi:MAG: subclass B2 metallo-beta-lactamase [Acidobacteria bacterium]|nr:subclass B2 metallo-beta-lactamase [Acidobacteriota bacterium]
MKSIPALALLALCASAAPPPPNTVTLTQFRGPIYLAIDTFYAQENSVVYVGPDSVTVVGATWTPHTAQLLTTEIRKITKKPIREVIIPDYHADRSGGAPYFHKTGARLVTRQQTFDLLKQRFENDVTGLRKGYAGFPPIPLVLPDTVHPGDYELQAGRIKVFYTGPAHTPDGVFVYFPQEKVLYTGCIIKSEIGSLASGDIDEYPKTILKLKAMKLDYDVILAGHFDPVQNPGLVDRFLKMLDDYRRKNAK